MQLILRERMRKRYYEKSYVNLRLYLFIRLLISLERDY